MSLSQDDLLAIKNIVDDAKEDIKVDVAAGFTEVHEKVDRLAQDLGGVKVDLEGVKGDLGGVKVDLEEVKNTVGRIELTQRAEAERADDHAVRISRLEAEAA
jgi:hypothetical protein